MLITSQRVVASKPGFARTIASGVLAVAALSWATPAVAQVGDVRVVMIASTESPSVGEEFQIQIEARQTAGQPGLLQEPSFAPLRVTGTTGVRHAQSIQQVFGSPPQIEIITHVGYTVVADLPGTFTVSPAILRLGRRSISSDPLIVKVGGAAAAQPAVVPSGTAVQAGTFDPYVFLRATVDRSDPYVGQQVTYTLYLYSRINERPEFTRQPSTGDFWVHDLVPPGRAIQPDVQIVEGQRFMVYALRRLALFPTREGALEIGSAAVEFDTSSPFDLFRGNRQVLARESPMLRLMARPLPANAPAGTVVGRAVLNATLDRPVATTGQAVALTVVVRGDGLLRDAVITPPVVDGLRFEAPTVVDQVTSPNDLVGGERTFAWQAIALRPGTFAIPPLTLPVLDPNTGRVENVTSQALSLTATGAPIVDDAEEQAQEDEAEEEQAANDEAIRFGPASRSSEMRRHALPFHARPWFLPALIAAPVLAAIAWGLRGFGFGIESVRARLAARGTPKRHRRDAKRALGSGDSAAFYASIAAMLHQALTESLGERTTGMTHAALRTALREQASRAGDDQVADDDLSGRVVDELDAADFARFSASGASEDEMRRTFERADALVTRLASRKRDGGAA